MDDRTGQKINPFWNYCEGQYIVELIDGTNYATADKDYFIITDVKISSKESDVKEITAFHYSSEWCVKQLRNYKSDVNGTLTPKNIREIFNDINNDKMNGTWKLGHVDPDVELRYMLVDVDQKNVWEFFEEVQKTLRCLIKYDVTLDTEKQHLTKVVNVYDMTVYPTCPVCGSSDVYYEESSIECHNPECGKTWGANRNVQVILSNTSSGDKKAYSFVLGDDPGNIVVPLSVDNTDALNSVCSVQAQEGSSSGSAVKYVNLSSGIYTFVFTLAGANTDKNPDCKVALYAQDDEDGINSKLLCELYADDFRTGDTYYRKITLDSPKKYLKVVLSGVNAGASCDVKYNGMFNILDDYGSGGAYDDIAVTVDGVRLLAATPDVLTSAEAQSFSGGWGFIVVNDANVTVNGADYHGQRGLYINQANWSKQIYARDTGLVVTDRNYIKELEERVDTTKLRTRLYIYGKNNLPIRDVNPTGQDYIDGLEFFRGFKDDDGWHSKYMTDDLLNELDAYDIQMSYYQKAFKQLLADKATLQDRYSKAVVVSEAQRNFLDGLNSELQTIEATMDDELAIMDKIKEATDKNRDYIYWKGIRYSIPVGVDELRAGLQTNIIDLNTKLSDKLDAAYHGDIIDITSSTDIDLDEYSLNSLKEALAVVDARIDSIEEYINTSDTPIVSQKLSLTTGWQKGTVLRISAAYDNAAETKYRTDIQAGDAEISLSVTTTSLSIPWDTMYSSQNHKFQSSTSKQTPTIEEWRKLVSKVNDDGELPYFWVEKKENGVYVPMVYGEDYVKTD